MTLSLSKVEERVLRGLSNATLKLDDDDRLVPLGRLRSDSTCIWRDGEIYEEIEEDGVAFERRLGRADGQLLAGAWRELDEPQDTAAAVATKKNTLEPADG